MTELFFKVVGLEPGYMMSNGNAMVQSEIAKLSSTTSRPGTKKKTPAEQAEDQAYRLPDGSLYAPQAAFRRALLMACSGTSVKIGRYSKRLGDLLSPVVTAPSEFAVLRHPKTKDPITQYTLDSRRAVNKNTGQSVVAFRGVVAEWSAIVCFEVDEEYVPDMNVLPSMFERAGKIVGIGAFRPQNNGPFGRFSVAHATAADLKAYRV